MAVLKQDGPCNAGEKILKSAEGDSIQVYESASGRKDQDPAERA